MAMRAVADARAAAVGKWSPGDWLQSLDLTISVTKALSQERIYSAVLTTDGESASNSAAKLKADAAKERARTKLEALLDELRKDDELPTLALVDVLKDAASTLAHSALPTGVAVPDDFDGLDFYREKVTTQALQLALDGHGLGGLTRPIWDGVMKLKSNAAADAVVLQDKFQQQGAGLMSYAGLSEFFSGLEGKIGAPNANVEAEMAAEHCKRPDSHYEFTTWNYEITSTSDKEFNFVAYPENKIFPVEAKLLRAEEAERSNSLDREPGLAELLRSGARKRTPLTRAQLEETLLAKNKELVEELSEPPVQVFEAIAARLYTGPLFEKYNGILRGLNSKVTFFRIKLMELCSPTAVPDDPLGGSAAHTAACRKALERVLSAENAAKRFYEPTADEEARLWEETQEAYWTAHKSLNRYTTTLHAINSSIIKLSKLTKAEVVYRGVAGRVLPPNFWRPNKFNVRGGIDPAFMSTTLDETVAKSYAASDKGSIVFAIQQGMIDRGADIGFVSQYPHEREILVSRAALPSPSPSPEASQSTPPNPSPNPHPALAREIIVERVVERPPSPVPSPS